jgi:transposase
MPIRRYSAADAGQIVHEARAASDRKALVAFRASGMAMERIGLEACSLTARLRQRLAEVGIMAVCIEARQAMGAMPGATSGTMQEE